MKKLLVVAAAVLTFCLLGASIGDANRKGVSEQFSGIGGTNAALAPLTPLPSSTTLWGLWPMDAVDGDGKMADFAPAKGTAPGPPNEATLSGTSGATSNSRSFHPGAAFFIGNTDGSGASGAHPLNPVYWGGGHALTFATSVKFSSTQTGEAVVVWSGAVSNNAVFFISLDYDAKRLQVFNRDLVTTLVNYNILADIPIEKFDDHFHSIAFARVAPPSANAFSPARTYLDGVMLNETSVQSTTDGSPIHEWNGTTDRAYLPGFSSGGVETTYTVEMRDTAVWKSTFTDNQVETLHQLCLRGTRLKTFLGL